MTASHRGCPQKKIGPRRLRINSDRNSECGSESLNRLDWSYWWTDELGGVRYIHVARCDWRDDPTFHRVFCRISDKPRLEMKDGVLYWLVDD